MVQFLLMALLTGQKELAVLYDWKKNSKSINRENISIETYSSKVKNFEECFEEIKSECTQMERPLPIKHPIKI